MTKGHRDLPENFYKGKKANVYCPPKTTSNQSHSNQDPNLPENFYKYYQQQQPNHTVPTPAPVQSQSSPRDNRLPENFYKHHQKKPVVVQKPVDPAIFELEQRLRKLTQSKEKHIPSVNNLQRRLNKLQGVDKPIPTVNDLEERLNGLRDNSQSPEKKRKVAPLIRVYPNSSNGGVEDLIAEAKDQLDLENFRGYAEKVFQSTENEEMTPEKLIEMIRNEPMSDDSSSDSTHDDFSSDLMTDDDSEIMSDDLEECVDKILTKRGSTNEWKRVARELIREARLEEEAEKSRERKA